MEPANSDMGAGAWPDTYKVDANARFDSSSELPEESGPTKYAYCRGSSELLTMKPSSKDCEHCAVIWYVLVTIGSPVVHALFCTGSVAMKGKIKIHTSI